MKKKVIRWKLKKLWLDSGKFAPKRVSGLVNHLVKHYEINAPVEKLAETVIRNAAEAQLFAEGG